MEKFLDVYDKKYDIDVEAFFKGGTVYVVVLQNNKSFKLVIFNKLFSVLEATNETLNSQAVLEHSYNQMLPQQVNIFKKLV